ncbi:MAG: nicotinate-nucleotide--dimethylbenzimidazole phosphoribosyltransferase, partial [Lachnospiraceae bacterium]|nr:nicotinate-nucleotide--dimethylbenzimidazole phosphoribosyltransferase [Lachnospiraceae bacterium]
LAIGEMGIGNTTTSSAITAAILHLPAEVVAGRGAGLDEKGLLRKRAVIRQALQNYGFYTERENLSNEVAKVGIVMDKKAPGEHAGQKEENEREKTLRILECVGGYDIACLAGICLGGAKYHVPIVLDGFISLAAALVACRLEPMTREYLIPSHSGKEPAVKAIEEELGLTPIIYAKMALGEGTGAVMMLQLLKTANAVLERSTSFAAANIEQYERFK